LVIAERFDPEDCLRLVEHYAIGGLVMVPTHFQRLLALPAAIRDQYDLSSLRDVTHTGSTCPVTVKRAMINWFGPVLVEGYGATEVGATNYISSDEWLRKPGSVGRAQPPFEPLILDDEDEPLGPMGEGRLYFRDRSGRGVLYPNDPDKTRAAHISPGVFTLGDRGYLDEDGFSSSPGAKRT
jgi:long-chain acyl-CoA synthetase